MNNIRLFAIVILAFIGVAIGVAPRVIGNPPQQTDNTGPWLRIQEDDDRVVYLEVAARTFSPTNGESPTITLAGAVHVGERRFYTTLQAFMDAHDVVLYEGVNPPGSGELPENASPRQRVDRTKSRMRLMAILLERHHAEHEEYPASLDRLAQALEHHKRQSHWLDEASVDAWSNPLAYTPADDGTFELVSLGADARPGGKGPNKDLRFSDQDPLSESELGAAPGIQQRLAETFRLRFQLDEMDETKDNWRNADMDVDQLQRRMGLSEDGDGDTVILFDLLDGSSSTAKMASMFLRLVESLPGAAPRGRLMIMEMLSLADENVLAAGMPGGADLIDVLIGDRNQVVIDQLKEILSEEPEQKNIGVIYGAGHMPDLEQRLMTQLGYEPSGETVWHTAMRLPLNRVGISVQERMMLRASILKQLQQLKAMQ